MKNILVFDPEISGHHSEYLIHLIRFLLRFPTTDKYFFVVHPDFWTFIPDDIKNSNIHDIVIFKLIDPKDLQLANRRNLILRSYYLYKILIFYTNIFNINHVVLMSINVFQFCFIFKRPNFQISGILFQPFYRMDTSLFRSKFKFYYKHVLTKLFIINPFISKIFILNDKEAVNWFNTKFKTSKFHWLVDPIHYITPDEFFDLKKYYNITEEKKIFLHIGSLSYRKGTYDIIDSLTLIDRKIVKNLVFIIIGKASPVDDVRLKDKVHRIRLMESNISIIYENVFLDPSLMRCYFDQSDYVLIPYKNIEGSSGILGHSILSKKPVIATNKGLIGSLVKEYNAGILIQESNKGYIANAIVSCLSHPFSIDKSEEYIKIHNTISFSKMILN